jgi:hypothetical protein
MKALVAGWFSFEEMGATAGDLLVRDLLCLWLSRNRVPYDVAVAKPFSGGVDWTSVDPNEYSHVVFACGPFGNGRPVAEFLARFARCSLVGVNLSMLESLEAWNPFDLLIERDSSRAARPDIVFLAEPSPVPIVGVVLIHPQPEYRERDLHETANGALRRLVAGLEVAAVPIDTRLDENQTGLRSPGEVESLIARMDVVLTTRLHGMVLALKNGVPVIAIDPVAGGAKISRQARTFGWDFVYLVGEITDEQLRTAFAACLTERVRLEAIACRNRARATLADVESRFASAFRRFGQASVG